MARRYALIVGISEYQKPLNSLSKTTNDAEAIAAVLKQFGDFQEITTLKGAVTSTRLIQALRTLLLEQATQNDVVIYFTGHGIPVVDPVVGKPKAYLATSDTVITLEGKQVSEQRRAVPLDSLNDLIQESQLSSLVMLFDSCHSGDFLERSLVEKTFAAFLNHKDYYLIAACRGFEQAYARKSEQHSIFTGALLAGLSQANANEDGQVTGDRLFEFIARELKGSGQEPIRRGNGGLITLVRYQPEQKVITAIVDETGEPICPYQGLQAFTTAQREFFFGRQRVVEDIRRRLEEKPFVPIIGASGSGKSSVVRAGLIPWLEETGWTVLTPIKPGFDPLAALRTVFEPFFQRSHRDIQQLHQLVQRDPNPLLALISRLSGVSFEPESCQRFLLIVDQFEELFTLCADESDRQRFIDLITGVTELTDARLAVIITMRADFLEPCLRYPALHQLIESQAKYVSSPTGIDLRDAIVKPAQRQGYDIEERLPFQIQEDVGKEPGFLPLLEFALTKLWELRDSSRKLLTLEQYENLGGLTGALDLHAERVYQYRDFERSCPSEQRSAQEQKWIQQIFLRLVRTGNEEKDTRQRQPKIELLEIAGSNPADQDALRELIEDEGGLVQGRLLVTGKEQPNTAAWVDLAHEALLDGWKRFAEWRKSDREVRRLRDRIEDAWREWEQNQQNSDFLLPKGLLAQIEIQSENLHPYLTSKLQEFYQLSRAREQEREAAIEWARSEGALDVRANEITKLLSREPLTGLAVVLQLVKLNLEGPGKELLGAIQNSLRQAMEWARECNCLYGHEDYTYTVAFSPNGQTIASGSRDCTIRLWNIEGNLIGKPFVGHTARVVSVAFSPDGQTIVSGSDDRTIRLWDLQGNLIGQPFIGHEDFVLSVAFSPDGQTIVSGSRDRTVGLWDLQGSLIGQPFIIHEGPVTSVAFSPDGQTIVSGSDDRTIRLWDLQGNLIGQPFMGHEDFVLSVAFSPDGQTIVSGSRDRTIRLWRLDGSSIGQPFIGHSDAVVSVEFSPDGKMIVSVSDDRTICLWDLQGNLIGQPLLGHENNIYAGTFSPDGKLIASASRDRTVRLWDVQSTSTQRLLTNHAGSVNSVAFNRSGNQFISGSDDKTIQLWDSEGTPIGSPFLGHEAAIYSVAFSPDGTKIVSGGFDKTIRLWDLQGSPIGKPFVGHRGIVISVALSPDAKLIVSGSGDGTVRLWDLQGNQIGQYLIGDKVAVWSVTFSSDGNLIAAGSDDKTIRLWDCNLNLVGNPITGHEGAVYCVAFNSKSTKLVSGSIDRTIRLWDVAGQPIGQPLVGHEDVVVSVAFSPDDTKIASGSFDRTIRLWDVAGQPIGQPLVGHEDAIWSVAFSPDSRRIASGSRDGQIHLWQVSTWQDWLATCCNRIRHHPYFKNPQTEEARAACEVCQKYVWSQESNVE